MTDSPGDASGYARPNGDFGINKYAFWMDVAGTFREVIRPALPDGLRL